MRQLTLVLAFASMALLGCDQSSARQRTNGASLRQADTTAATPVAEAQPQDRAQRDAEQRRTLSTRLTDRASLAEQLWPDDGGEAGLNWLRNSAAGSGLELTAAMPGDVIERSGVAVCPAALRAEGEWADVVSWLEAIEASPRRLVLRGVALNTRGNRVVVDLEVVVLIGRPTELVPLAEADIAELRGEALDKMVQLMETELESKHRLLHELGADMSWSRPIAEMSELIPPSARPMKLSLALTDHGQRAQAFKGAFTLAVSDAGQVPGYVRGLQKRSGFTAAGLASLRRAEAGWQRAVVTFTFTDTARPAVLPSHLSSVAEVAVTNP